MRDEVRIRDHLVLDGGGQHIEVPDVEDRIQIAGFFSCVCRERGKIVPGTYRSGKNIWTLAGREFLARLMSYISLSPLTPARNDRIRYIGFGTGYTTEVSSVTRLVNPIAYDSAGGGQFMAELNVPTFPFQAVGSYVTSVRYSREFSELELSPSSPVALTEAGLFTDGSPTSSPVAFAPGTRDRSLAQATSQAPSAYKSFEPLKKTQNFVLQVAWEIRF